MDTDNPIPDEPRDLAGDATTRNDLSRVAAAQRDAVWGAIDDRTVGARKGLPFVARVLTGEIGPKGEITSELRKMRVGRRAEHIPRGTIVSGGGFLIFLTLTIIVGVAVALLALLLWVVY